MNDNFNFLNHFIKINLFLKIHASKNNTFLFLKKTERHLFLKKNNYFVDLYAEQISNKINLILIFFNNFCYSNVILNSNTLKRKYSFKNIFLNWSIREASEMYSLKNCYWDNRNLLLTYSNEGGVLRKQLGKNEVIELFNKPNTNKLFKVKSNIVEL